jgi:uncharacterized protein (UPF0276 family)
MFKIATPISHLFKNEADARLITSHSDCLECRDHSPEEKNIQLHELFHFEMQIIHPIDGDGFRYIEDICKSKPYLKLVSFHVASCCDRPTIDLEDEPPHKYQIYRIGGNVYTYEEMQKIAAANISRIKSFLPKHITICVENNNYLLSDAYNDVIEPKFLSDLVINNDINFLYDIAHAHISAINMGITFEQYYNGLPLSRTKQVHICKFGMRNKGLAWDAHYAPDEFIFSEVRKIMSDADIDYVTVEYYKEVDGLVKSLAYLKNLQNEFSR